MKETLEEAAEKYANDNIDSYSLDIAFYNGANWQAERMYSEEEVFKLLENYDRELKLDTFAYTKACTFTVTEWFSQFKKLQ